MGVAGEEEPVDGPASCEEKIFVSVRLRPLNEKELVRNEVPDWECIDDNTIIYRNNLSISERSMYPAAYTFDRVFGCKCSTRQVYEEGAKRVALSVVSGINSSVFAYGQTSSGKTYTMSGITEYTVADIYDYIERHKEREYVLKFCAMEIYNESVRDLLSADSTPLRLLDDPERGTVVERLTEETLKDWNHFKELLSVCEAQRQIGETALNETSSRSHQILRLTIDSSAREFSGCDKLSTLTATVNFVDLAGSERASQSLSAGTRLKEGCHINRSLLTLGTVIRKLSKGRNGHIPFRDSKLTRILQSSLGGNSRTAIICTMSPARIHVEQSRNTLLFASCAKEVTTNAQVNVVMSDKALVKHLQRELARLESELRSGSRVNSLPSDFAALLREKDIEIEKLKKEVAELTLQLDLARSQLQNQLHVVEEERPPEAEVKEDDLYPRLRVRSSWDQEDPISVTPNEDLTLATPTFKDFHCLEIGVGSFDASQYSDGHSSSTCDGTEEQFIQLIEPDENFPESNSSPRQSISSVESRMEEEGIQDHIELDQEDLCREVRCIETEDSGPSNNVTSKTSAINSCMMSSKEQPDTFPLSIVTTLNTAEQDLGSPKSLTMIEDKELNSIHQIFVTTSSGKSSPSVMEKDIVSTSGNVVLGRSQSCKESLMTNLSLQWCNSMEKNERTPPDEIMKEYTCRPDGFQKKVSTLKFDIDADTEYSSRNDSYKTILSPSGQELSGQDMANSCSKDIPFTSDGEVATDLQHEEPAKEKVQETTLEHNAIAKSVRDIGLDPIADLPCSPPNWSSEFLKIQKEIIELWHACNIPLVHRSHFFLLFKGDPSDSIYMEVELRRLSFVKEKSFRGNQTLVDALSVKALQRERQMLSKRMKKLPEPDRENLYLKWGIGLNTKHRRLQLAHRIWTNMKDIEHITASATLVARLVGFINPDNAFKEMFGFGFVPRSLPAHKRFYHSLTRRHSMEPSYRGL